MICRLLKLLGWDHIEPNGPYTTLNGVLRNTDGRTALTCRICKKLFGE